MKPIVKTGVLFSVVLFAVISSFLFAYMHKEDFDNRVAFSLINQNGENVSQASYQGQYLLVFFGFTHCPHICPVGMSKITQIMDSLDNQFDGVNVKPVFISVDPERDDVNQVDGYIKKFHQSFDGLTGSDYAIQQVSESFNTFFKKQSYEQKDYDVMHSSMIYVVDPFSRVVGSISSSDPADTAVNQLKTLMF